MSQKPNVKLSTFAIENTGEPFLFKVDPQTLAQAETVDLTQDQGFSIDGEGNMNLAFGDEPTLILGSTPERAFEDGFWINDKDSITFSPIFNTQAQDEQNEEEVVPAPKGFFGIRVLPGVTKFHIVTIVQDKEPEELHEENDAEAEEELSDEEINELNDIFDSMQEDEKSGELFYKPIGEAGFTNGDAGTLDADFANNEFEQVPAPQHIDPFKNVTDAEIKPLANFVDFIIDKEQQRFVEKGARAATPRIDEPHFLLSLPGMAFITGRHNYARTTLAEIAKQINEAMALEQSPIAARSMRASARMSIKAFETELWFASIVDSFIGHTGDYDFVKSKLWNVMKQITNTITEKNTYQLSINEHALLEVMIAEKKHVRAHLNALWYNHLRIMEKFAHEFREEMEQIARYSQLARKLKREFNARLWDDALHGVIDFDGDNTMTNTRPEHTFILSLEHSILSQEKEKQLLARIWKDLYTPYGLKSTSPAGAGAFKARPLDGVRKVDRAADKFGFENDQSWASFVGPFIKSYVKVQNHTKKSKEFAKRCLLTPLVQNMNMLSVEELAMARDVMPTETIEKSRQLIWNISELMRSYVEDIDEVKMKK